jgi:ABC-type lipoprotein export system ATPase subunit
VLADEPTGDLDADNAEAVYDLLVAATAATGAALLLVTHDARGARVGDRVVRIRDGRVTETWSPSRPELETLVVDDRGWLRLPDAVRAASGVGSGVLVEVNDGRVLLRAAQPRTPHDGDGLPAASAVTAPRNEAVAALEGVSRSRQGRPLFGPLDLRVRPGSLMVLRGPSGSGKSTLLRTLVGLERPDAGRVEILGQPLADLDRDALALLRRRHVAVAGQATSLAESLDVVSNVELARALRQQPAAPARVGAAIDAVGLTALARRSVEVLSGGERQRVAIARVLAVDAVLAVFDEPTSKLDERGAALVAALLRSLADGGRAVVCATHDLRLADVADVIIEIGAPGRIDSERPDLASHAPHL